MVVGAGSGEGAVGAGSGGGAAGAGSGGGAAGAGSGGCVVGVGSGEGAAIEIGIHAVWETVFVGDETIKYVYSSFCRKDHRHRILCSFEGAGVRDVEGRVNDVVSGHGRKKLVVVHLGANYVGKVYSEVLKNRYRILGKQLKVKGCEVMFPGILPRLGNNVENMSRAIDVNQWLEEWWREESFTFKKQWESFQGQSECFHNDGPKSELRFALSHQVFVLSVCSIFMDFYKS